MMNQDDAYAIVHKRNGTFFKQELFMGSTYLSSLPGQPAFRMK
jgi:hypothetical protein